MLDVKPIKDRLGAAHKGPWHVAEACSDVLDESLSTPEAPWFDQAEDDCILGPNGEEVLGCSEWLRCDRADLEFMAHARSDIPALIEEVELLKSNNIAWLWEQFRLLENECVADMHEVKSFIDWIQNTHDSSRESANSPTCALLRS